MSAEWRCGCGGNLNEVRRFAGKVMRPITAQGDIIDDLPQSLSLAEMEPIHTPIAVCDTCGAAAGVDELRRALTSKRTTHATRRMLETAQADAAGKE